MTEALAPQRAADHFDLRHTEYADFVAPRFDGITDRVAKRLEQEQPARLLDAGCGSARLAWHTGQWARPPLYLAVDSSRCMLAEAIACQRVQRVAPLHAAVGELPIRDGWADASVLLNVLQFTVSPVTALRDVLRVTRPGGLLAVATVRLIELQGPGTLVGPVAAAYVDRLLLTAASAHVLDITDDERIDEDAAIAGDEIVGLLRGLSPGPRVNAALDQTWLPGQSAALRVSASVYICRRASRKEPR